MTTFEEVRDTSMALLKEVESVDFLWTMANAPPVHETVAYEAVKEEWVVIVARFSIEDQGFPAGSVGYDGCLRKGMNIVRMTRDLAERLWKKADYQQNPC